ncbi:Clp protease N-terminal domain-containing protein [Streptomyces phaeofaciens JCM 4814]|uniref:Peptidase n=1 Tax=Streptomyces phaeofaciens TaxID=68254 RepID=A0A918HKU8_9ACTN|nr:peptidase [Streptomyces phaeofaciens]
MAQGGARPREVNGLISSVRRRFRPARSALRGTPKWFPAGMPRPAGTDGVGDVQPRIPRQSTHERAPHGSDDDPRLGAEPAAAVAAARRRALRDGDRQIDTAHLLHSLLEHDPQVRAAFDGGPQIARLLGYLVQRSIGYGLRWQSGVEDSGALPVVAEAGALPAVAEAGVLPVVAEAGGLPAVAEAGALPVVPEAGVLPAAPAVTAVEGFSPLAAAALEHACERAALRGPAPARGVDLLVAIVVDPQARAVEVLTRAGVDVYELRARVERPAQDCAGDGDAVPY